MAVNAVPPIPDLFDLDEDDPIFDETGTFGLHRTITVCGVPLVLRIFDRDDDDPDFDETGTFCLHLGGLRRFARLGRPENPVSDEPASER